MVRCLPLRRRRSCALLRPACSIVNLARVWAKLGTAGRAKGAAATAGLVSPRPHRMAASTTPFRISTPLTSPPPRWATLERELLHTLGDACEEFFLKCGS